MRCFRKLLSISYRDHITNEGVKARIGSAIGPYEDLLTSVKRRKLKWNRHVTRSSGMDKTIQGWRRRGRQRKRWEDNTKEWTGLEWNIILRKAENREEWRKLQWTSDTSFYLGAVMETPSHTEPQAVRAALDLRHLVHLGAVMETPSHTEPQAVRAALDLRHLVHLGAVMQTPSLIEPQAVRAALDPRHRVSAWRWYRNAIPHRAPSCLGCNGS